MTYAKVTYPNTDHTRAFWELRYKQLDQWFVKNRQKHTITIPKEEKDNGN